MTSLRTYGLVLLVASVLSCTSSGDKYIGTWKGTNHVTLAVTKLGDSYRVSVTDDRVPYLGDVMTAKYENGSLIMGTDALVLSNGTITLQGVAYSKQ